MKSEWVHAPYKIRQHQGGAIFEHEVLGVKMCGFGIHETEHGWNITHLKSGWATFMSRTEKGAKLIANYLISNYSAEFERLNINGCTAENFQLLAGRIEADEELWNLRRLYVIPPRELNLRGTEPQPRLEVIS